MRENKNERFFPSVARGTGTAVIVSLIGVLAFAFIVKISFLPSGTVKAVNQFLKILSVFLGCVFSIKGGKGLVKGLFIGVLATVVVHLIFSLISGVSLMNLSIVIELGFGGLIGAVSGIIAVNFKRQE